MLLAIQVALTIAAWRKGWRAWALLPVGCSLAFGMLLGATVEDISTVSGVALLGDVICTAVLGVLASWVPQPATLPAEQEAAA